MSTVDAFDRLVEQQDQELARDGVVSPSTRLRLEALAQGHLLPPVGPSPAVEEDRELFHLFGPARHWEREGE